ncbi:phosphotransferase [Deinococcus sp. YIM 134068]|uniref:phosphotransferase n=1 Tax=Deinococcus lichenicola TaxID=3118910 RepID=UPI002F9211F1
MTLAADAFPPLVPETLLERALLAYALPEPTELRFLRRGYNDHSLVTAGGQRFILRVYLDDKPYLRGPHDFLSEVEVLAGLKAQGVSVSSPIARRDGTLLGRVEDAHGERHVALFEFAEGDEVSGGELSESAAHHLGLTVATLHLRADEARLGHRRPSLDETFLVDRPVAALQRMLGQEAGFLREYGEGLKRRLSRLPRDAGAFGFVHGDLHLGNVHVSEEHGCTLFDFDHSGLGWRAYDLAVLRLRLDETRWNALLGGYRTVRPWSQRDMDSVPLFTEVRQLWDPGDWFAMWETGAWGRSSLEEVPPARLLERLRVLANAGTD